MDFARRAPRMRALTRWLSSPTPAVRQPALVWEGLDRARAVSAAFEAHDAAMKRGFMPDEATTLSMVVAHLGTSGASASHGALFFDAEGWRVELAGARLGAVEHLPHELAASVSSVRRVQRAGRDVVVVAARRGP